MRRRIVLLALALAVFAMNSRLTAEAKVVSGVASGLAAASVAAAGVAVTILPAGWMPAYSVCDIVNPPTATEPLYVDLVQPAQVGAATSIPLSPGQAYRISAAIARDVSATAATAGHPIVGVCY